MYLTELEIVVEFLNQNTKGAIIKNVYRSNGGTLFKLFGGSCDAIYFNLPKKVMFPVADDDVFKKENITNLEESLRKYLKNQRIQSISLLSGFGKTVLIEFPIFSIIIPLYGKLVPFIKDKSNQVIWSLKKDFELTPLRKEMNYFEPKITNPLLWPLSFINEIESEILKAKEKEAEKRLAFLFQKQTSLQDELEKNQRQSIEFREKGVLLKSNLYRFEPDSKIPSVEICLFDGSTQLINLDLSLSLSQNMQKFFEKAKKCERGYSKALELIDDIVREIKQLQNDAGIVNIEKLQQPLPLPKKQQEHSPYHTFSTKKGVIFLVGKSSSDNDELTFKISSPHDMWFHVVDMGGSHIIMRKNKNYIPTEDDIFLGCALALFYSKARKGMSGEVWYTERKNISKKKGMAPGKVLITKAKSKYLRADETFLEKLEKQ